MQVDHAMSSCDSALPSRVRDRSPESLQQREWALGSCHQLGYVAGGASVAEGVVHDAEGIQEGHEQLDPVNTGRLLSCRGFRQRGRLAEWLPFLLGEGASTHERPWEGHPGIVVVVGAIDLQ